MKWIGVNFFALCITCYLLLFVCSGYAQKVPDVHMDSFRNKTHDSLNVVSCKKYSITANSKPQLQSSCVYDAKGYLSYVDTLLYDSLGQIAVRQRRSYQYDGQHVSIYHLQLLADHTDTTSIQVYHFNNQNWLIGLDETNVEKRWTRSETYEYDTHGNCTLLTVLLNGMAFKEYRYDMTYDGQHRLIRIMQGNELIEENAYNASNRLMSRKTGNCSEQFTYKDGGKLSTRKQQCAANIYSMGGCHNRTESYSYDKKNRLSLYAVKCGNTGSSTRIIGLNQQARYTYNANGLLKHVDIRSEGYRWNYLYEYEFN